MGKRASQFDRPCSLSGQEGELEVTPWKGLVINPGSTSTKLAVYDEDSTITAINHSAQSLAQSGTLRSTRFPQRSPARVAGEIGVNLHSITAVVCRGGLLRPIQGRLHGE